MLPKPGRTKINHLEQVVAEWLQYNEYFVRTSVLVGPRERGGHAGELGVVGFKPKTGHFVDVECSLDASTWRAREAKFEDKFKRGQMFAHKLFDGLTLPEKLDQIAVIQVSNTDRSEISGGRLITMRELIHEIYLGLKAKSPLKAAVSSDLPLLRTLQLAADANAKSVRGHRLVPEPRSSRAKRGDPALV